MELWTIEKIKEEILKENKGNTLIIPVTEAIDFPFNEL
jgi:hypothetical protein